MELKKAENPNTKILSGVVYDQQRDNIIDPLKTCFPTSVAMVLRSLEAGENGGRGRKYFISKKLEGKLTKDLQDNRELYTKIMISKVGGWASRYFPRYVFGFWVWYINNKLDGFKAEFKRLSFDRLLIHLEYHQTPAIIGTKLTGAGHIIVVKGYNSRKKLFVCNDPYGNAHTNYQNPNGEDVRYFDKQLPNIMNVLLIKRDD